MDTIIFNCLLSKRNSSQCWAVFNCRFNIHARSFWYQQPTCQSGMDFIKELAAPTHGVWHVVISVVFSRQIGGVHVQEICFSRGTVPHKECCSTVLLQVEVAFCKRVHVVILQRTLNTRK